MSIIHFTLIGTVALLLEACSRCGPTEGHVDEETTTEDGSDTAASTGGASQTSTTGGPLVCPEGETPCGGECADFRWSEDHCGSCFHACKVVGGVGECWEGMCPPTSYCATADQGFTTCGEVCASYGETCVDAEPQVPGSCGGDRYGLLYEINADFDCEVGYVASASVMGGCDDTIRWDLEAGPNGGSPPDAVSCCCTQP